MKNIIPRVISGIVYAVLIIVGCTYRPFILIGMLGLFLLLSFIEYIKITKITDKVYLSLSLLVSVAIFFLYAKDFLTVYRSNALTSYFPFILQSLSFAGPVLFIVAVFTIFYSSEELLLDFGKATVAVIYIAVPFSLALTIPSMKYDFGEKILNYELLFVFILLWVSDSSAYIFGSLFGKRKLAPKISQNKTWEGFLGGVLFTIIGGCIIQYYFSENIYGNWIIIGLIIAITAPIGDLTESKLKRIFKIKDSGNLIPGHGGFLDRLDSLIFTIPFVYLYLLLYHTL